MRETTVAGAISACGFNGRDVGARSKGRSGDRTEVDAGSILAAFGERRSPPRANALETTWVKNARRAGPELRTVEDPLQLRLNAAIGLRARNGSPSFAELFDLVWRGSRMSFAVSR